MTLRAAEPQRDWSAGLWPAAREHGQGTWQCCATPGSSQAAAHRAALRKICAAREDSG